MLNHKLFFGLLLAMMAREITLAADKPANRLSYNDGKAEGKKSLGGSGEVITFTLPEAGKKVRALRIHGSRYGLPQPPKEDFEVHFLNAKTNESVGDRSASYGLFKRGSEYWVDVKFKEPVEVPAEFKVVLNFHAQQTKGVYVSFDTSSGGKYSQVGLPGGELKNVTFDGDWMIEAVLGD